MRPLLVCFILTNSYVGYAEEKPELSHTAKHNYDFSFIPEVVAVYNDERLRSDAFLKLLQPRLKKLTSTIQDKQRLRDMCLAFLDEYYKRQANLDLAYQAGYSINQGLAELELASLQKKVGKVELEKQFEFTGLDFSQAAKFYAESKIINKYFTEHIFENVKISEADALVHYFDNEKAFTKEESVRIDQMFFPFRDEESKDFAKKQASGALKDLSAGNSFQETAKKYYSAIDLDRNKNRQFFSRVDLRASLRSAFDLKVGMFSGALESEQGIHIIKVLERRPAGVLPFQEIKDVLIQELTRIKALETLKERIVTQLKSGNFKVFIK